MYNSWCISIKRMSHHVVPCTVLHRTTGHPDSVEMGMMTSHYSSPLIDQVNMQFSQLIFLQCGKTEGNKLAAVTHIELVLEFDPMKPQSMKEC